jgi:hypothetical protein
MFENKDKFIWPGVLQSGAGIMDTRQTARIKVLSVPGASKIGSRITLAQHSVAWNTPTTRDFTTKGKTNDDRN